jgi:hypothetical protein
MLRCITHTESQPIVHVRLPSVTDKVQFEKMIRSSEYIDKFINSCNKFQELLTLGAPCLFHIHEAPCGVKNDPRHISGTTAPRNKISTATPIFEVKLFNSANANFISRDLIPEINMATVKMQASSVFLYNEGRNQN